MTDRQCETGISLLVILVMGLARISLTPLWANAEEPYRFMRLRTGLSAPPVPCS